MVRDLIVLFLVLSLGGCTPVSPPPEVHGGRDHGHEAEHEHAEHEEAGHPQVGFVKLSPAQVRELGVELRLVSGGGSGVSTVRTGRVEVDPDRRVIVSSQLSGTVRHLPITVGAKLNRGDQIAVLDSPEVTVLKGEYHAAQVEVELARKELTNTRSLLAVGDESRRDVEEAELEVAQAKAKRDAVSARLESARLSYERLLTLREEGIASTQQVEQSRAELKAFQADLGEAASTLAIAIRHRDREKQIFSSELRQKAETLPAEANLARAQETLEHLEERLRQFGADPSQNEGALALFSPISGEVVERPVNRGQMVPAGETIAVLVDPTQVWVWIDLLREDLVSVEVGDPVEIALASQPAVKTEATIDHIDPTLDQASQTVRARVLLREPGLKFRVGSFVSATLRDLQSPHPSVPQDAIVEVEGQTVVYRLEGEGYRRTPVEIVKSGTDSALVKGLPSASQVVVKGASALKSVDLSGTIGGHSH